jgi:hypothetical protein
MFYEKEVGYEAPPLRILQKGVHAAEARPTASLLLRLASPACLSATPFQPDVATARKGP